MNTSRMMPVYVLWSLKAILATPMVRLPSNNTISTIYSRYENINLLFFFHNFIKHIFRYFSPSTCSIFLKEHQECKNEVLLYIRNKTFLEFLARVPKIKLYLKNRASLGVSSHPFSAII